MQLNQQCEDRTVLRYVYYYLARILSDTGSQGLSSGGGIPTPNWDALADIDAIGGVTRADVVPRIVNQLTNESLSEEVEFHARRIQALKALTYSPSSNPEILAKLYEIVFGILDNIDRVMGVGGDPSWHQHTSLGMEGEIGKGDGDHSSIDHQKGISESGRAVISLDPSTHPRSWGINQRNPMAIARLPEEQQQGKPTLLGWLLLPSLGIGSPADRLCIQHHRSHACTCASQ